MDQQLRTTESTIDDAKNTFDIDNIKPTCVKILTADDYDKSLISYDAEVYEGGNDSNIISCSTIPQQPRVSINISEISTSINLHQQQNPSHHVYSLEHLSERLLSNPVVQMRINLEQQQMDSGANRNVTDDKHIIRNYLTIKNIPVFGIGRDEVACEIVGKGITELMTTDGTSMVINMYYAPGCAGTVISPNAIVRDNKQYTGWVQTSHLDTGTANMLFFHRNDARQNKCIQMKLLNDLWYINQDYSTLITAANRTHICLLHDYIDPGYVQIHKLTKATEYELWHQRLMHSGHTCLDSIHLCTNGTPKLSRHPMHKCHICAEMNPTKKLNKQMHEAPITRFGERFQMDFGFMSIKTDNTVVRSHDGYNCYLLVIEYYTRYLWIFLTKNKNPPIQTVTQFLRTYGNQDGVHVIRTDQGGELARSKLFRETIQKAQYSLEVTGADNSSQNAIVERPHRTLANMVRSGLENAGLHYKYWSDAILHATFVKNRLPHKHFDNKITPYEKLTGHKPDLSFLRIFGSRIVTRKPGKRSPKISKHLYTGIFLRYAKTMKNIVYLDTKTKKIKTTTFAKFDEAHFTHQNKPPGAQILFELGLREQPSNERIGTPSSHPLQIIKKHDDAIIPSKGSEKAAGFDLYSVSTVTIPSQHIGVVDTGIAAIFPPQTYGRIASRSGLSVKHSIEVGGGVIDPDYTGPIKVILHNFGSDTFTVKPKDRVAQLIIEQFLSPPIKIQTRSPSTTRAEKGFGSTGITDTPHTIPNAQPHKANQTGHIIPYNNSELANSKYTAINTTRTLLHSCKLQMNFQSPVFTTTVTIQKRGHHPTLGLQLRNDNQGPLITMCIPGTPAARVYKWKQVLKNSRIHSINDTLVDSTSNITQIIKDSVDTSITLTVIPPTPTHIHPDTGVPQLNFDQFIHIAAIHQHILEDTQSVVVHEELDDFSHIVVNKLSKNAMTRANLMKQDDWPDWEQSEFLQLNQYEKQEMFGPPGSIPSDENEYSILPMIWVYLIKTDGRKKARCVANGAPHLKGTITLAATYAACLDQSANRLFWSFVAIKCKQVFGADAQNAFAEAPPPTTPLYLKIDDAFRNWWYHKKHEWISPNSYVRVNHAIQGHPESPRLWNIHIDKILAKMGYIPTTHEPCIYVNHTPTESLYLLRQVDDFAFACDDPSTAVAFWDELDTYLKAPLKRERGRITRHNGIDILQSDHGIKIYAETYLTKILSTKTFDFKNIHTKPLPMHSDNEHITTLETTVGPSELTEQTILQNAHGMKYRNSTGELIFAMVTCRADIAFPITKLSQYNNRPAECHYRAIIDVYRYLKATISEGIMYWRPRPSKSLPSYTTSAPHEEPYNVAIPTESNDCQLVYAMADSDFAGDRKTRKSVGGTLIFLGGAAIVY